MFEFFRVHAQLLDHLLDQQFLGEIVDDHHSAPVDLPVLNLHLFGEEVCVETFEVIWIGFVEHLGCLVEQKDQLFLCEYFLALHLGLFVRFSRFHEQRLLKKPVKMDEGKPGVEDAPIQQQGDGFAVLEQIGF